MVVLNTANPNSDSAQGYKAEIEEKYGVSVIPLNCMELSTVDIRNVMERLLLEFPIREIAINIPSWLTALDDNNWLKEQIRNGIVSASEGIEKISDMRSFANRLGENEYIDEAVLQTTDLGTGAAVVNAVIGDGTYYKIVEEMTGFKVDDRQDLMETLKQLAEIKRQYDKIAIALTEVNQKGYGIVSPGIDELTLEEPEIMRQGSKFGIRLRASAPSIHMICNKPKFLKTA